MPADIIASKFLRWDTIVHLLSNGTIAIAGVSSQHVHFIHARNQDSSMFLRLFLGQDRPNNLGRVVCWSTAADRVLIVNEYGVLSGWVQDNKVFELSVINHDEKILGHICLTLLMLERF